MPKVEKHHLRVMSPASELDWIEISNKLNNKVFILNLKAIKTKKSAKLRDRMSTTDLINRWLPFYCGTVGVKVRNDSYSRSRWFEKKEISNTAISFFPLSLFSCIQVPFSGQVQCVVLRTERTLLIGRLRQLHHAARDAHVFLFPSAAS